MELRLRKKIYIIRHAKSSWKDSSLSDFDRPLNKRGKKDAPFMAELLRKKGIFFDKVVCSPANRTKTTAKILLQAINSHEILYDENIYEASYKDLLKIINSTDDKVKNLAIIGHNPSLNDICEHLCKCVIDNIPTCGCILMSFDGKWRDVCQNSARIEFFEYPKKHIF